MLWVVAALATSVLSANGAEINRRYQQEGFRLNLWRTLLITCFWAPLAMIMDWPDDPMFYGAAIFGGLGMIVGNVVQSDLSARHNGRVAIIHMPLKALFVYLVWLALDPVARAHLVESPAVVAGVTACFAVMIYAMNTMRNNDASWSALRALAPVVVLYGMGDILTRAVMPADELGDRLIIYLFLMTGVSAVSSLMLYPWRPKPELPFYSPKLLQAAGYAALSSAANHVCFMIGLTHAPNPAYVSMIAMLAPVWLLLYNRARGIPDTANPWAGTALAVAAIVLMIITI